MTLSVKVVCALVAALMLAGAIAVGAGAPLSPGAIAQSARDAAANLDVAEKNIEGAVEDTEALAEISRSVQSQVQASRRLLQIQLRIERASRKGTDLSTSLTSNIRLLSKALARVEGRLRLVASQSDRVTTAASSSESAASVLKDTLNELGARFQVALKESRELNRKARAYDEIAP
ncbi:MAG: hypothetical protein M3280_09800 [Actinomycetota bacterium]|nr:hypothetical protein [Actinomycetota bacterium]